MSIHPALIRLLLSCLKFSRGLFLIPSGVLGLVQASCLSNSFALCLARIACEAVRYRSSTGSCSCSKSWGSSAQIPAIIDSFPRLVAIACRVGFMFSCLIGLSCIGSYVCLFHPQFSLFASATFLLFQALEESVKQRCLKRKGAHKKRKKFVYVPIVNSILSKVGPLWLSAWRLMRFCLLILCEILSIGCVYDLLYHDVYYRDELQFYDQKQLLVSSTFCFVIMYHSRHLLCTAFACFCAGSQAVRASLRLAGSPSRSALLSHVADQRPVACTSKPVPPGVATGLCKLQRTQ